MVNQKNFESSDSHEKGLKDEGAKRFDLGKLRWDLLPYDSLEKVVEVFTHGASKYDDENWRQGMAYKRMYGPIFRHLTKSISGEDIDPDSFCFHLAQVAWGSICLLWYQMNNVGEDDRVKINSINDIYKYLGSENEDRRKNEFWKIIEYWTKKRTEKLKKEENKKATYIKSDDKIPKPDDQYIHFKGNIYTIVCVSFDTEGIYKALVTYKDKHDKYWTRPLESFNGNVKHQDRTIKRFKRWETNEC